MTCKFDCFVLQYKNAAEGSEKKSEMLKQITETMRHRKHLDASIDMIGVILFGPDKGSRILNSVRARGLPLVDDWQCLKSMVTFFFLLKQTHIILWFFSLLWYMLEFYICRFVFSRLTVGHSLNMAWNTWGHLPISATVVCPKPWWKKLLRLRAVAMSWGNGIQQLEVIALDIDLIKFKQKLITVGSCIQ